MAVKRKTFTRKTPKTRAPDEVLRLGKELAEMFLRHNQEHEDRRFDVFDRAFKLASQNRRMQVDLAIAYLGGK